MQGGQAGGRLSWGPQKGTVSLDTPWSTSTLALVKGLVIKRATPSRNPSQVSPQLWVPPVGKEGSGSLRGRGATWGRVWSGERSPSQGRGIPVGGGACPGGGTSSERKGMPVGEEGA